MARQVDVLGFHGIDERLRDANRELVECRFFLLELNGAYGHFFADEALDVASLDFEMAAVRCALDGVLELGEFDGLDEVVHGALRERFGGGRGVVDRREHQHRDIGIQL